MESYYRGGGYAAFWRVPEPAFKLKSTPNLKCFKQGLRPNSDSTSPRIHTQVHAEFEIVSWTHEMDSNSTSI